MKKGITKKYHQENGCSIDSNWSKDILVAQSMYVLSANYCSQSCCTARGMNAAAVIHSSYCQPNTGICCNAFGRQPLVTCCSDCGRYQMTANYIPAVPEHYGVLQIARLQKLPLTVQYTPSPLLQQREN